MSGTLAATIGGTEITVGYVPDGATEPLDTVKFPTGKVREGATQTELGILFEQDTTGVLSAAHNLKRRHDAIRMGITLAGELDKGVIVRCGNLLHLVGRNMADVVSEALNLPVVVENDAVGDALAQALHGPTRECFRYYIHGTGFGSCLITLNYGQISYQPEEPGHDKDLAHDMACHAQPEQTLTGMCGTVDCLESYVCEWGIQARHGLAPEEMLPDTWHGLVLPRLAWGIQAWQREEETPYIVMGGGVPQKRQEYIPWLADSLSMLLGDRAPDVSLPVLGARAGLIGAAAVANLPR